ncbi:recombinase family protein [Nocardia arizonensis]|uniref:recombinase family protein n=1 Tax=Nocardia arizonensis TaxID=1141647 RepID=UPI0009EBDD7A|nr:recombinase family protein [Nocardia arizonensis]
MRIGYGRVSTRDQHPEAQHDALTAAGCEQIFIDKASGKLASRPELSKALLVANRPKDQLVVTKLDRLGRSLEHLIELSKTLQDRGVDGMWGPVERKLALAGLVRLARVAHATGAVGRQSIRRQGGDPMTLSVTPGMPCGLLRLRPCVVRPSP